MERRRVGMRALKGVGRARFLLVRSLGVRAGAPTAPCQRLSRAATASTAVAVADRGQHSAGRADRVDAVLGRDGGGGAGGGGGGAEVGREPEPKGKARARPAAATLSRTREREHDVGTATPAPRLAATAMSLLPLLVLVLLILHSPRRHYISLEAGVVGVRWVSTAQKRSSEV